MGKHTAIVLGGTAPHIDLIRKLKSRQYHVVLADYLEKPIAAPYADEHVRISTLDCDDVLKLAKDREAELVISSCVDQANATACFVAEKLGLPQPFSYQKSLEATNKKRMKEIFVKNNIPTARYHSICDISELKEEALRFPLVVKPADCNSSKGVTKVQNMEDLRKYAIKALELSRTHTAVIEEFVEGSEIHIDCMISNGKAKVLLSKEKKMADRVTGISMNHYGSIIPARLNDAQYTEACEIAQRITDAFQLKNTPMFYQAIVNPTGIYVLEFASRIGGGLGSFLIEHIAGVDIIEASIDSYLGRDVDITATKLDAVYSTNLIYVEAGVFGRVEGLEKLMESGIAEATFVYQQPGEYIDGDMKSGNRVAAYIIKAEDYGALRDKEMQAEKFITVYDIDGCPMKRK